MIKDSKQQQIEGYRRVICRIKHPARQEFAKAYAKFLLGTDREPYYTDWGLKFISAQNIVKKLNEVLL